MLSLEAALANLFWFNNRPLETENIFPELPCQWLSKIPEAHTIDESIFDSIQALDGFINAPKLSNLSG